MKKLLLFFAAIAALLALPMNGLAGEHDGHTMNNGDKASMDQGTSGTYEHSMVVEGIRVEFQVMSLASMKMHDPAGNTHHIMVRFFHEGMDHALPGVVGKIKVISPAKKEQVNSLNDYGGVLAANFTFNEPGNWGVICLFQIDGKNKVAKFWYPHS